MVCACACTCAHVCALQGRLLLHGLSVCSDALGKEQFPPSCMVTVSHWVTGHRKPVDITRTGMCSQVLFAFLKMVNLPAERIHMCPMMDSFASALERKRQGSGLSDSQVTGSAYRVPSLGGRGDGRRGRAGRAPSPRLRPRPPHTCRARADRAAGPDFPGPAQPPSRDPWMPQEQEHAKPKPPHSGLGPPFFPEVRVHGGAAPPAFPCGSITHCGAGRR